MPPVTAGPKTVLCVDDTPYVLQMLDMFLTAVGYRAVPASTTYRSMWKPAGASLNPGCTATRLWARSADSREE